MPLKYKKLVVLFSLGIMLIGLGTFSMLSPNFRFSFGSSKDNNLSEAATFGAIKPIDGKSKADIQSEIEDLITGYFLAKQQVDMDAIGQCVSDVSYIDEKKLLADSEYIEEYKNIQCMILDGAKEGAYRVYVYYEVKIYDIDTLVPALNVLYVTMDEDKQFRIYFGTLDSEEQKCLNELDQSEEVKDLVATVQNRFENVVSSDSKVREFYEMLESVEEDSSETEENENIDQEGQTATTAPN